MASGSRHTARRTADRPSRRAAAPGTVRIALLAAFALGSIGVPAKTRAQDLQVTVEAEEFFVDEPAWLLAFRPALGYDPQTGVYPQVGMSFGYDFPSHVYLGGNIAGRFNYPYHVRIGARLGVFYRSADLAFGIGVSPGMMIIPRPRQVGALVTWGGEARYRLSDRFFLTAFVEVDLVFEALGFRDNNWLLSGGLGFTIAF